MAKIFCQSEQSIQPMIRIVKHISAYLVKWSIMGIHFLFDLQDSFLLEERLLLLLFLIILLLGLLLHPLLLPKNHTVPQLQPVKQHPISSLKPKTNKYTFLLSFFTFPKTTQSHSFNQWSSIRFVPWNQKQTMIHCSPLILLGLFLQFSPPSSLSSKLHNPTQLQPGRNILFVPWNHAEISHLFHFQ